MGREPKTQSDVVPAVW